MTPRYPLLVDLAGKRVLVVGGGAVAARKVRGVLAVGAVVTVCAPELDAELHALAGATSLAWEPQRYRAGHASAGWAFVIAATDDRVVNEQVVADATDAGTWANDATSPTGGPAALPAVHRAGPITLAVATGGAHPGAAAWLRDLAADAIGPDPVTAVELVAEVQAEAGSQARLDWRAAVDSGMLSLIREGRRAEAKERLQACLSSSSD